MLPGSLNALIHFKQICFICHGNLLNTCFSKVYELSSLKTDLNLSFSNASNQIICLDLSQSSLLQALLYCEVNPGTTGYTVIILHIC